MVPNISLGAGVPRLISGLGTSFLFLCLLSFEVLRDSRACSIEVLRFPFFSYLALRTSISPGHSSFLHIGSNPVEAPSSGRTDRVRQFGCGGSPGCPWGASFPLR